MLLMRNEATDGEDAELQIGNGRTEPGGPTLPMLSTVGTSVSPSSGRRVRLKKLNIQPEAVTRLVERSGGKRD